MKRIFLNVLVIGILFIDIILLILSQRIPNNKSDFKPVDQQEETTVIRIAKKNYSQTSKFAELINDFNNSNEYNIQINMIDLSNSNYQTELNYLMTSSLEPDIMNIDSDWIRTYIEKRWLIDLREYITDDMLGSQTKEVMEYLSDYTLNDEVYMFPTSLITYRLMYNANLFEQYGINDGYGPRTFDEMVQLAGQLSKAGKEKNLYGFVLPLKDMQEGFKKNLEAPSTKSGINYYNIETKKVDFTVYEDWFYAITEMINNNTILPGYENVDMNLALNQFAEENVGMVFVTSDDCSTIRSLHKSNDDWRIILPPDHESSSDDSNQLMMSYGNFYAVSKNTKDLEKTIIVWNYLNSKEFIQELFSEGECIPIDYNAQNLKNYINLDPMIRDFIPTKKEIIYPVYIPEAENLHRLSAYLNCLNQQDDIKEILLKENYYVKHNIK
jgi:ABC-type glycerol-3-phosphate transport system substrate-binding protein